MNRIPFVENNYGIVQTTKRNEISAIPEQVREIAAVNGFSINILVISRRGLGASTLINSLFAAPLVDKSRTDDFTTSVNIIVENDIKLKVSVTTYHKEDHKRIIKYIEDANVTYFENEQGLTHYFEDSRIHLCLYLIPGDKMTNNEIEGMREISLKCNLLPVITKADMFTLEELAEYRTSIYNQIAEGRVEFFRYSMFDEENAEEIRFPLATIASEAVYEQNGIFVRGRSYPWGFIDIENKEFSDFMSLQQIIIDIHFEDLISKTDRVFYNEYRKSLMGKENTPSVLKKRLEKLELQMLQILEARHKKKIEDLDKEESDLLTSLLPKLSINDKSMDTQGLAAQ